MTADRTLANMAREVAGLLREASVRTRLGDTELAAVHIEQAAKVWEAIADKLERVEIQWIQ